MPGEHDGDRPGRLSEGLHLRRGGREDKVDLQTDQVGREFGQAFGRLSPSEYKSNVLALDIAVVLQAHPQCGYPVRRLGAGTITQISDLVDLRWLLRPNSEGRGEEATSEGGEERTSVHKELPPDRPSRRDRSDRRPSGLTLPQRRAVWLGLLLPLQALAHEVLPLIPESGKPAVLKVGATPPLWLSA